MVYVAFYAPQEVLSWNYDVGDERAGGAGEGGAEEEGRQGQEEEGGGGHRTFQKENQSIDSFLLLSSWFLLLVFVNTNDKKLKFSLSKIDILLIEFWCFRKINGT